MPESNPELARAVTEVLEWLGAGPETAGALLGINGRTLGAMCEGIVPMRSLVIRFGAGIAHQCEHREGATAWWRDVDAWLRIAGYTPRRDAPPPPPLRERTIVTHLEPPPEPPRRSGEGQQGSFRPVAPAPQPDEPAARDCYHPIYERREMGDTFVHIFWILDQQDRRIFEISMAPREDYRARARQVKHDLAALPRSRFERKYARYRVGGGPGGDAPPGSR